MSGGSQRLRRIERSAFWWHLSSGLIRLFGRVYLRLRSEGREHVPSAGPVLLVANHASYLDPPMLGTTSPRIVDFLAQAGLARFAPLRWWLRQVGVTLIDRDAPSKDAMRLLSTCLKDGDVVGVFPEGTRSPDGKVGPFKSGVEFLVRRGRPVVVPVGIEGTYRAMPRRAWLPRPRKVVVRYGKPWTAEQVLAPGGVEALRREVARLARAELRSEPTAVGARRDGGGDSVKGAAPATVDPTTSTSSTSTSAGGGA
ncbi:MAG TPA: 1-acyl-sn-glycerol-3-phosphate acyltransferase [bacterium]|nr:1-acyl-sn-glycerol-3-phosphate acyltransferase [bacterium]